MTISEIWEAIDAGKTVHWENQLYHVHPVAVETGNKYAAPSRRGNQALRVTCTHNWFGSLMGGCEPKKCYIAGNKL